MHLPVAKLTLKNPSRGTPGTYLLRPEAAGGEWDVTEVPMSESREGEGG